MIQEQNTQNIETGDRVMVVYAWGADEMPNDSNFHFGEVEESFYKEMGEVALLKFKVSGIEVPVSADRIRLIEKSDASLTSFVHINYAKAAAVLQKAHSKGWRGCITASNLNRDEFEVLSASDNTYKVRFHFSDATDEVFGSCDCLYFLNAKKLCKHCALVGIDELYSALEIRRAA